METDERLLHQVLGGISVVAEHTGETHQRTTFLCEHLRHENIGIGSKRRCRCCVQRHVNVTAIESGGPRATDVVVELSVEGEDPADHGEREDVQSMQEAHQQE
jgi:hypothetical protein